MKWTPAQSPGPDNSPRPLRTLVVDDSVVLLRALCAFMKTQSQFHVVGTAGNGSEALGLAEVLGPDLILMDLNMPVMDGLQATAILRRRVPHLRIIIMTMEDSPAAEAKARAQGAHGFIGKRQIISNLIAVVRRTFHQ